MGILDENLPAFAAMCARENAPFAVVGRTTGADELVLNDTHFENKPIDMPLSMLLGKPPQMHRTAAHRTVVRTPLNTADIDLREAAHRVLALPTVASKSFLITIGDRSITGQVARDQMFQLGKHGTVKDGIIAPIRSSSALNCVLLQRSHYQRGQPRARRRARQGAQGREGREGRAPTHHLGRP